MAGVAAAAEVAICGARMQRPPFAARERRNRRPRRPTADTAEVAVCGARLRRPPPMSLGCRSCRGCRLWQKNVEAAVFGAEGAVFGREARGAWPPQRRTMRRRSHNCRSRARRPFAAERLRPKAARPSATNGSLCIRVPQTAGSAPKTAASPAGVGRMTPTRVLRHAGAAQRLQHARAGSAREVTRDTQSPGTRGLANRAVPTPGAHGTRSSTGGHTTQPLRAFQRGPGHGAPRACGYNQLGALPARLRRLPEPRPGGSARHQVRVPASV